MSDLKIQAMNEEQRKNLEAGLNQLRKVLESSVENGKPLLSDLSLNNMLVQSDGQVRIFDTNAVAKSKDVTEYNYNIRYNRLNLMVKVLETIERVKKNLNITFNDTPSSKQ